MAENTANKQSLNLEVENEFRKISEENSSDNKRSFRLLEEHELRVLVGGNSTDVKIELSRGLAEIYGTEMVKNKQYQLLPYSTISVFTWHGCVINVSGNPEAAYVVKEPTAMILSVILHASLERCRLQADEENGKGPVIFVVGPNEADRSSLCRLLLNYAVRMGRRPTFVDLDVGQNSISMPSSIGVLTLQEPADIVTGFINRAVQVYHFGYKSVWQNIRFYFLLLQRLGLTLESDLRQANQNVRSSGVIISGCDDDATTLVTKNFEIDCLCVLQEESLYLKLQEVMPSSMKIIFIPQVNGVENNRMAESKSREACIREYFYGPTNQLQPCTFEVKYSDIQVFTVVTLCVERHAHFLADITPNEAKVVPIRLSSKLVGQVLGLSSAKDVKEDIMYIELIGFICITKVDMDSKTITVLAPLPGPLPKKILLLGDTRLENWQ